MSATGTIRGYAPACTPTELQRIKSKQAKTQQQQQSLSLDIAANPSNTSTKRMLDRRRWSSTVCRAKPWRRIALCVVVMAVSSWRVSAVKNCGECPKDKVCILESPSFDFQGGEQSLKLSFCNYDKTKTYAMEFLAQVPPTCQHTDPKEIYPVVTRQTVEEPCPPDNCIVNLALASPLDWALVLLPNSERNTLLARVSPSTGGDEPYAPIGRTPAINTAKLEPMTTNQPSVSMCATTFPVVGTRFSHVKACNAIRLCSNGGGNDAACFDKGFSIAMIDGVECQGEKCTGTIQLDQGLACGSTANANSNLMAKLTVGKGTESEPQAIAALSGVYTLVEMPRLLMFVDSVAPAFTIQGVDGLGTGSSSLVLSADGACPLNNVTVAISASGDAKIPQVAAASAVTNSSIAVELAAQVSAALQGQSVDLTFSQCGVASKPFTATVSGSSTSQPSNAEAAGNATANGMHSAQQSDAQVGLPGGTIIAIAIAVVAVVGFFVECWYHKRRHAAQPGPSDPHEAPPEYAHTTL